MMRGTLVVAAAVAALGLGFAGSTAETVSISVRPLINPTTAFGAVASGKSGQSVTVQFKQCGLYPISFRDVRETTTGDGGNWTVDVGAPTNGAFRAVSGGAVSDEVKVLERADVRMMPFPRGRYEVAVVAFVSFWRKHVLLQRFDRQRRAWVLVRKLVLQNTFGPGLIWATTNRFTVKLPRGTTIRAVLPLAQAKPCYLAGYSKLVQT